MSAVEPIRYYFDSHIPAAVAQQLTLKGVDVLRCQEVALTDADDVEHLEYATAHKRTLVSNDSDFREYHSLWIGQGLDHAGIIVFNRKFQGDIGKFVRELLEYHELVREGAASLEDDIFNHLIEIDR